MCKETLLLKSNCNLNTKNIRVLFFVNVKFIIYLRIVEMRANREEMRNHNQYYHMAEAKAV